MMSAILVYITASTDEEAETIARFLLEKRLVACANMMPSIKSLFWWDDKIDEAQEVVLIAKTRADLFDKVEKAVCEKHSYDVPCIVALPIADGHMPFLEWIDQETQLVT
jgi:periplasmic divalent cation tolerance protein